MNRDALDTYLNDHLAGSVAALELLGHLSGGATTREWRQFFVDLERDVAEDQQKLQDLLQRVGGAESRLRKAGAWVTEKLGQLKLRFDDTVGGGLRQLEALETLALGIQGKLALWRALEAVSDHCPEVREMDFPRLQQRARDQYARVESRRLAVARAVLGAVSSRGLR